MCVRSPRPVARSPRHRCTAGPGERKFAVLARTRVDRCRCGCGPRGSAAHRGSGTQGRVMARKAVVAMSGGVDSSVSAALLVEAGYDVTGIMLKLWKGEDQNNNSGCCNLGAAEDARRVADVLGIPFYVFNFAERFEETVIANFHADYAAGRTPNPCVRCNQWIKFGTLLERAEQLGADILATGHYARVREDGGRFKL